MDLSKAFDCLPHRLLLCKLYKYGVSLPSCSLIWSYLYHRKQRVKLESSRSEWAGITKGVQQGSILGPLLFNIFINDMLYFFEDMCSISNYADDNTLKHSHRDTTVLKETLERGTNKAIVWFEENDMKANPSKFQGLFLSNACDISSFDIQGFDIPVESDV